MDYKSLYSQTAALPFNLYKNTYQHRVFIEHY